MQVWSNVDGRWAAGETPGGATWFDLNRSDAQALRDLAVRYGLHHLAIEDCLSPYLHTPKMEDYGEHVFFVLADMVDGRDGPQLEELDAFLGRDFLITYHDRDSPPPAIASVATALAQGQLVRSGVSGLFHEVVDRSVDSMIPRVAAMGMELDDIEDRILTSGNAREDQRRVLARRALAGNLRRLLSPEQQFMLRLGRGECSVVEAENIPYFRDVYDHLLRVDLSLEEIREDTEVALNMYLSSINNRLSEVMKVLAVVSALALPGTLITGVFGTNFDNVPGLHSNGGFALMVASIAGIAVGMAYFFRRRGWF